MSLIERLSNTFSAAKKAWQQDPEDQLAEVKLPDNFPPVNVYYVDTMAPADPAAPTAPGTTVVPPPPYKGLVETRYEKMSADMNTELANGAPDFDKLQSMIYKVIMLMMRMAAKSDMEQIHEFSVKIKQQAYEIQGTYNTWQGLTITVISAAVSFGGAGAGLSPFIPFNISPDTVRALVNASQSIGTASTGLSSLGSAFDKRSEGTRSVMQTFQRIMQEKEEERKTGKQTKNEHIKTAKAADKENDDAKHQAYNAATT